MSIWSFEAGQVFDPFVGLPRVLTDPLIKAALAEDLGQAGDLTSCMTVNEDATAAGPVIARKPGVVCGLNIAARAFSLVDRNIHPNILVADGSEVDGRTAIMRVSGPAAPILSAERTALNFVGHLSGIATATKELVKAVEGTKADVCCTRKTTPGLRALEKYAVRCGGGKNHRFGLADGILIKDNHIVAAGGLEHAIKRAQSVGHMVKIEAEVETLDQLKVCLDAGIDAVLLDNMDLETMRKAVEMADGNLLVEASGNITVDKAKDVADTGVDLISVGWITHSAPSLDVGLDLEQLG